MKIKLRASEFDKIEWKVKEFSPGNILWKPPEEVIRSIKKTYKKIKVKVPCRLNIAILDMSKLCLSGQDPRCEPGSVSMGCNLFSEAEVELTNQPNIVVEEGSERPLIVRHFALLMKKLTGYGGGFRIKTKGHGHSHIGLGSTASIIDAVAFAINETLGNPIDDRWLVKILAYNYGEEGRTPNKLFPGQSTGASGWVAKKGGFIVVSSFAELVHRSDFPEGYVIVAGSPTKQGKGITKSEVENPNLDMLRHYDRFMASRICYWTLMDLMPAAIQQDVKKMGDIIWDFMVTSGKGLQTIIPRKDLRPFNVMVELRKVGIEVVFLSSVGPAIIAVTKTPKKAEKIFNSYDFKIIKSDPNNKGIEILSKTPY